MPVPMMFEDRKGYATAERAAALALGSIDPASVASERGVEYDAGASLFRIPFLGATVTVTYPEGVPGMDGQELSGAVAVLALHYLAYRGEPLAKQGWLAYRDMPGARHFASAFEEMAEKRVAGRFGASPADLVEAARLLGGVPGEPGDASARIHAFPRVPLLVVLWGDCEGVAASSRILFRPSAPYYFHSEDLAALGVVVAERLGGPRGGVGDDV
jgi:hypothetical protein